VFKIIETEMPEIKDDQILIKVKATSVNPIDVKLIPIKFPFK